MRTTVAVLSFIMALGAGPLAGWGAEDKPGTEPGVGADAETAAPAQKPWLEVVRLRLTAKGTLIDVRYKIHDAPDLTRLNHANSFLEKESTGDLFTVQGVTKIGQLAPSDRSQHPDTVLYALFQNRGRKVESGDLLNVVISGLRQPHVRVE